MRRGLIDTVVRAQRSWMRAVASVTGGSTFTLGGIECVHQPLPHGELLLPFPEGVDALEDVVGWARSHGVSRIGVWEDGGSPTLLPAGVAPGWAPHWMAAAPSASEPDPRVERVAEVAEYDDHGRALLDLARGGVADLFVAREDGGEFAGHCWLHDGGVFDLFVVERFRGRGLGRALTEAALTRAAGLGLGHVTLNAEAPAERLYRSLGFETLGDGRTWWIHRPQFAAFRSDADSPGC